jgi:hypothetical protein
MTIERIANKHCRSYVQQCKPFQGSNIYGRTVSDRYVVYSYGEHFPMFIKTHGRWYENADRYSLGDKFSTSTARHRSLAHPSSHTVKLSTEQMIQLAEGGYTALATDRVLGRELRPYGWDVIGGLSA